MKPKVLLLEDDYLQRRDIQAMLEEEFSASMRAKSSESEFRGSFEEICEEPPDIAILDVMVRWASPSREAIEIPEFAKHPEVAGLRCAELLREDPRTAGVKVILYSVLSKEDFGDAAIPEGVSIMVKEQNFEDAGRNPRVPSKNG
jgi:DNA-binding NarL/FixJ family response regulator